MESFWIAETLKYLYMLQVAAADNIRERLYALIHAIKKHRTADSPPLGVRLRTRPQDDEAGIDLERFVINTEAHPLPIVRCPTPP
jgi:hypothetical protein